ncbi:MAG: hypothetical protein ACYDGN_09220 [Acidimicrobiales bacterium]
MAGDSVFLLDGSGLEVLQRRPYDNEAVLQKALAEFPAVIAGPTTTAQGEVGLLLVCREMGVPGAENGRDTWSLDHLFLDGDGVPVLVETKRSSDTRLRREVVGQILDYAANAVVYWPIDRLRATFEATAEEAGHDPELLIEQLRPGSDIEDFWRQVAANLRAGRVRMLIVADKLPPELVRIIEFLNEQMSPAEILGVELPQYTPAQSSSSAVQVLVPRVLGRTAAAVEAKTPSGGGHRWDRASFDEEARRRCPQGALQLIDALLDDVANHGLRVSWGKGTTASAAGWYTVGGSDSGVWVINAGGEGAGGSPRLEIYFGLLVKRLAAAGEGPERLDAAAKLLETVSGWREKIEDARHNGWDKYPQLPLSSFSADSIPTVLDAVHHLLDP